MKRMVWYYDAAKGLNPELQEEYRRMKLQRIINYIEKNFPDYKISGDDLFNIEKYEMPTRDADGKQTTNIEVLRRLMDAPHPGNAADQRPLYQTFAGRHDGRQISFRDP